MVACYDNLVMVSYISMQELPRKREGTHFVWMRLGVEPSDGCLKFFQRACLRKIPGMNEDIPGRQVWQGVMRV